MTQTPACHTEKNDAKFLQKVLDDAYLPLMSCTLIVAQRPKAAARTVRHIFRAVAAAPREMWRPERLVTEMLTIAPREVSLEGYSPSIFHTLGAMNNFGDLPPGRRPALQLKPLRNSFAKPPIPNRSETAMPVAETWILSPLLDKDPDPARREIKAGLLRWLSELVTSAKMAAILGAWYGFFPGDPGADARLAAMAAVMRQSTQRTQQLWQTQHDLWEEIFASDGPALFVALELWLESLSLTKEELYRKCSA